MVYSSQTEARLAEACLREANGSRVIAEATAAKHHVVLADQAVVVSAAAAAAWDARGGVRVGRPGVGARSARNHRGETRIRATSTR